MQHGTIDMSGLAESIKVRGKDVNPAEARPSLSERIKQSLGIKVAAAQQQADMERTGEEIDMLDE